MLTHPTHDRLVALGLTGMAKALEEQRKQPDMAALGFEERLALMVDREAIERENKRLVSQACANRPSSRTSTSRPSAVSIRHCSPSSSPAIGSHGTRAC